MLTRRSGGVSSPGAVLAALAALLLASCAASGSVMLAAPARVAQASDRIPTHGKSLFLLGLNYPWINYGHDFGLTAWGHNGVSAVLAGWWRPQEDPGNDGIAKVIRADDRARTGGHSLKLITNLVADPGPRNGEAFVDLRYHPPVGISSPANLEGVTLHAWIYAPPGSSGDPSHPNGLQVFVKDRNWLSEYGTWVNFLPGQWNEVVLTPSRVAPPLGWMDPGFDPAQIVMVGVKVGIGSDSTASFAGAFYLDSFTADGTMWYDFENPSQAELDFQEMAAFGVRVLRWFVFADGRAAPEFDATGTVTGLDSYVYDDMDAALDAAENADVYLLPVLLDFHLCDTPTFLDGVQMGGHSDLITDPAKQQSFLDSAITPLLARYGAEPRILAWDLMNEPEWAMLIEGGAIVGQPVPPEAMQQFLGAVAQAVKAGAPGQSVTIGSASRKWLPLWQDTGLDFYQYHYYDWMEEETPFDVLYADLGLDKPCLLGEFPTASTEISLPTYLETPWANGLAGTLAWSYRAIDDFSVRQEHFAEVVGPAFAAWRQAHADVPVDPVIFADVARNFWAWAEIEACAGNGLVTGYKDGRYRPNWYVNRDQMAVFLARGVAGGEDLIPSGPAVATFTDVAADFWAYDHIEYLAQQQVAMGFGDGTYGPKRTVNRGQMAAFVARAMVPIEERPDLAGYTPPATPTFEDVSTSFKFYNAIEYVNEHGVAHGFSDGKYHPEYPCTRAQMAVFLAKAFGLLE